MGWDGAAKIQDEKRLEELKKEQLETMTPQESQ